MFFLSSLKFKTSLKIVLFSFVFLIWAGCGNYTDSDSTKKAIKEAQVLKLEEISWIDNYIRADTVSTPLNEVNLNQQQQLSIPLDKVRLSMEEASMENPYMQAVAEIQERYTNRLLSIEGVNAIGITLTEDRRIAFHVGTDYPMTPATNRLLPKELEGIPIIYRVAPVVIRSLKPVKIE